MNIAPFEEFAATVGPPEENPLLEVPTDVFPVPTGEHGYTRSGELIFPVIAGYHLWFVRAGKLHEIEYDRDGTRLCPLTKERAVSGLEELAAATGKRIARFEKVNKDGKIYPVWRNTTMPLRSMEILMVTNAARKYLPEIRQLVSCPVLVEDQDSRCKTLAKGFHPHGGGTYITDGEAPPEVPLNSAIEALRGLHADFAFCSPEDKSRAIAVMISPGLKMGGFIQEDFPIHVAEAVESQSGKDYLQKLHSRIYNERPAGIAPPKGGVGSLDETISKALISGKPFICLSNFRGKLESAILETAIRGQGRVECRSLRISATVDCTPFIWQMSTNGAEFTRDLANRAIITRIRKQSEGYRFNTYPEGDLLAHIEANQAFYLGCVFAVIREWTACGKPRTSDPRHDFKEWTQSLDWIVQTIFRAAPLLDGHKEEQVRTANPALQWLRDLANAVIAQKLEGKLMTASELVDVCDEAGLDLPGRKDSAEESKHKIGRVLSRLFKEGHILDQNTVRLTVDGLAVTRETFQEYNDQRQLRTRQHYLFESG